MQLGLDEGTGEALALYNVDSPVGTDALDELRKLDNVSSVYNLRL
jgi:hypothetical protein